VSPDREWRPATSCAADTRCWILAVTSQARSIPADFRQSQSSASKGNRTALSCSNRPGSPHLYRLADVPFDLTASPPTPSPRQTRSTAKHAASGLDYSGANFWSCNSLGSSCLRTPDIALEPCGESSEHDLCNKALLRPKARCR
jgi:hypothetical protein